MARKVTPQEVYEASRDATYQMKQEGKVPDDYRLPPATWEEVSERDKAIYAVMALKMNSISAEFSEE